MKQNFVHKLIVNAIKNEASKEMERCLAHSSLIAQSKFSQNLIQEFFSVTGLMHSPYFIASSHELT